MAANAPNAAAAILEAIFITLISKTREHTAPGKNYNKPLTQSVFYLWKVEEKSMTGSKTFYAFAECKNKDCNYCDECKGKRVDYGTYTETDH